MRGGAGVEVKAAVARGLSFSLSHSGGEEEEKLAGGPAVALHTNTG